MSRAASHAIPRCCLVAVLLAGCARDAPAPVEPRPVVVPAYLPVPSVIDEAAKVQRDAAHVAATRDDLSAADLLRMLDLSHTMQRAVRQMRAHRTAANVAAVRASIRALREFMARPSGDTSSWSPK